MDLSSSESCYTTIDVAEGFGVTRSTVNGWARRGQLKHQRSERGRILVSISAIKAFERLSRHKFNIERVRRLHPRECLTTTEAAALLGVTPPSIARWFDQGVLDGFRTPGGHRRIYLDSLERYLDQPGD